MTTDGGATWQRRYGAAAGFLDMLDQGHGWAVTPAGLVATTDGTCWHTEPPPPEPLAAVDFVDRAVGYAVTVAGAGRSASLLASNDGGLHWRPVTSPAGPQSLCFSDRAHGYLGAGGRVYATADGARTWKPVLTAPSIGVRQTADVHCAGGRGVWVLFTGDAVAAGNRPYVLYRSGNGAEWTPVLEQTQFHYPPAPAGPGAYPGPLSVIDSRSAAFLGNNPAVGHGQTVPMIATDEGTQLAEGNPVPSLTAAVSASFPTISRGWVVGPLATGGWTVYVTVDGGATWLPQLHFDAPPAR